MYANSQIQCRTSLIETKPIFGTLRNRSETILCEQSPMTVIVLKFLT